MAKGSSRNGFKTFIFLLIAVISSAVLGIGAFLMISPESNVFGVSYVANIEKISFKNVLKNNESVKLDMSDYTKVIFKTQNANVKILCGKENANESNIVLEKNSFGYYIGESKTDYSYNFYAWGSILYFTLYEPEYSFLKLYGNTNLILNISDFEELDTNIDFEIETENGSVTFGGATSPNEVNPSLISVRRLSVVTQNGNVNINEKVEIRDDLSIRTGHGSANINLDLSTLQFLFDSNGGKLTTKDFTNDLSRLYINTAQGNLSFKNISGDVNLNSVGGYFNANLIKGNFETTPNINTTRINIDKVEGNVIIINEEGNFKVNIKEVLGDVNIKTSGGSIKLDNLLGETIIQTKSASVDVTMNKTNTKKLTINTESGNISADFKNISSNHFLKTLSGQINVNFSSNCSFLLNAYSEKGYINKVWLNEKTTGETISNFRIGFSSFFFLDLNSESGNIIIDKYNE